MGKILFSIIFQIPENAQHDTLRYKLDNKGNQKKGTNMSDNTQKSVNTGNPQLTTFTRNTVPTRPSSSESATKGSTERK